MSGTEIETLVVRLAGDATSYQKMLKDATTATQQAAQQVQQAAQKIEGITGNLKSFATGAVAALAALGASQWLRNAFGEWDVAETTALRLEAAIKANGAAVEPLMAQYREFAAQLQEVTVIGDDTTLAVLAQAESFNLSGEAAIRATRAATAFAAVNDGAASSYLRLTAAIERGDIETAMMMSRMVPQLRGIKDESTFVARAQQLVAAGMAAAEAQARSSGGQIKQLKNAYGDLLEDMGKVVAQGIAPVVTGLRDHIRWLQSLSDESKTTIVVTAAIVAGYVAVVPAIQAYVTWTRLATVATATFKLAAVGLGVYLGVQLANAIANATEEGQRLNRELQRARDMSEALSGMESRARQETIRLVDTALPQDQRRVAEEQLSASNTQLAGMRANLAAMEREAEAMAPTWRSLWQHERDAYNQQLDLIDQQRNRIREMGGLVNELNTRIQRMEPSQKAIIKFNEVTKELEKQLATFGMTTQQIAIYELRLAGASEAQLRSAGNLRRMLDRMTKEAEVQKAVDDLVKSLREQAATYNMTAAEAAVYRLQMQGATADQLASARALNLQIHAQDAWMDMVKRSDEITKQFRTPLQQVTEQIAELQKLSEFGLLSDETMTEAMKDIDRQLLDIARDAHKAGAEIGRFDAALSGSAEAASRVAEFRERMSGGDTRERDRLRAQATDAARILAAQGRADFMGASREARIARLSAEPGAGGDFGSQERTDTVVTILQEIRDAVVETAEEPTIQFESVGFDF